MALDYAGSELRAMARAHNYYRWIIREWREYISGTVLEVGAGTGNVSALLCRQGPTRLILVEPSHQLVAQLHARFRTEPLVEIHNGVTEDLADVMRGAVDAIVSVNVLEHIDDDLGTLQAACRMLRSGGHLLLFVPALPLLYGSLDAAFGHVRRYTSATLTGLLVDAGFAPLRVKYFNALGVLPWLLTGRLLRRSTLDPFAVALADRVLIPVASTIERFISPPLGQSLIAVARKP